MEYVCSFHHIPSRCPTQEATEEQPEQERDTRTEAEKKFEAKMMAAEEKRLAKLAAVSHRDRVREFNEKLEALSEHHDIPKVGPG